MVIFNGNFFDNTHQRSQPPETSNIIEQAKAQHLSVPGRSSKYVTQDIVIVIRVPVQLTKNQIKNARFFILDKFNDEKREKTPFSTLQLPLITFSFQRKSEILPCFHHIQTCLH